MEQTTVFGPSASVIEIPIPVKYVIPEGIWREQHGLNALKRTLDCSGRLVLDAPVNISSLAGSVRAALFDQLQLGEHLEDACCLGPVAADILEPMEHTVEL